MSQRPMPENTNARQHTPDGAGTHPIYVKDADASREEPLDAFMIPSKYISPAAKARVSPPRGPKREKAAMYSQIAAPAAMDRIRRPRVEIPVAALSTKRDEAVLHLRRFAKHARAFSLAAFAFIAAKTTAVWEFVAEKAHGLFQTGSRTKYSAVRGAAVRKFGMPKALFRTSAALAALLLVFGLGILSGWFSNGGTGGGNTANGGNGGSDGNTVIKVQQSSDKNNGQSGTSTPQTAGSPSAGGSGSVQQSDGTVQGVGSSGFYGASGSTAPAIGGMGGGSGLTTPTTSGGGGGTTSATNTGGGGGSAAPPSGGGTGGGTGLPVVTDPSLPEIPSTDCLCGELQQVQTLAEPVTDTVTSTVPKL